MIVKCTACHHEAQVTANIEPCDWCDAPMRSIGSDYMSDCDDSITPHRMTSDIPDEDAELPLDFFGGVDALLRVR